MWFRLVLPNTVPLSAVVASEGILYWRLNDIALVLGKKAPNSYAARIRPTIRGSDVMRDGKYTTNHTRLCTTEHAHDLLQRENVFKARMFAETILRGQGAVTFPSHIRFADNYKQSPVLTVTENGPIDLPDWMCHFIQDSLWIRMPRDLTVETEAEQDSTPATAERVLLPDLPRPCLAVLNAAPPPDSQEPDSEEPFPDREDTLTRESDPHEETTAAAEDDAEPHVFIMTQRVLDRVRGGDWLLTTRQDMPARIWVQRGAVYKEYSIQ